MQEIIHLCNKGLKKVTGTSLLVHGNVRGYRHFKPFETGAVTHALKYVTSGRNSLSKDACGF